MLAPITRFLTCIDIPDNGTNRTTRLLNWITLAISLIALLYVGLFSVLVGRPDIIVFGLCVVALSTVINIAARYGQTRVAVFIFVLGIWLIITVPNLAPDADGIYDAAFTAYIVPILLAGFLLGGRASFIFAFMSVFAGLGFLLRGLSASVTFISAEPSSQILHFSSESLFFLIAAALFSLTYRSMTDAIDRARSSEENLLLRNRELEREVSERQLAEAALKVRDETAKQFQDYLKELHEVNVRLADVATLDELHRQAIQLGRTRLGFDRIGWFVPDKETTSLRGTYGTDFQGNIRSESDLVIELTIDNWTNSFQRFSANGHVYFLSDTKLMDYDKTLGMGWNIFAAVSHGEKILGWIASDNFINHEPLHDYQLELMRLYGAILGQLYVQKQTQQMLAEKEKRLQFALNAANMRSWDWDMQTGDIVRYTMYDPDAAPISAATADFVEHIHADDRKEFFDAATRMIESSGIYECEFRFTEDDGALHWLYALGQPYRDENNQHIAGVAGVIQDITGRKSIEETLKRADQQAMELTLQKERVGALTEFISTISHDFKTPLAIINNSLYLLQRISDPVKQKDKLNLIKDQTLLLDKQIQDILTISRLDYAPQVKSHPVNINILASKIDDIFRASFENKKLTLKLELEQSLPTVSADADELDRALVNLVENAINYTPVGGTITITTRVSNKHVECEVCDTGIGMTSQDTQKVFNNFYRAENARMINSKGTGLGLAIVKKIVTNHNGTIDVESELGQGTCFRLRFPAMVPVQ